MDVLLILVKFAENILTECLSSVHDTSDGETRSCMLRVQERFRYYVYTYSKPLVDPQFVFGVIVPLAHSTVSVFNGASLVSTTLKRYASLETVSTTPMRYTFHWSS
jgi:hypothetical protein